MAPTFTKRGRVLRQETGTNRDTWGEEQNAGSFDRGDDMWGTVAIAVDAPVTLTAAEGMADQARELTIICTGAGGHPVSTPSGIDKPYVVVNDCADDITFGPNGGTKATVRAGTKAVIVIDADGMEARALDPTLDQIRAAAADVDFNGQKAANLAPGTSANDAATLSNKVHDFAAPTASFDMAGQRIVNLGAPVDPGDAATRGYIDLLASSSSLGIVAGIASEIQAVVLLAPEIIAVADNAADVEIVAGNIGAVVTVADNIAAVIAAAAGIPDLKRVARTANTQIVVGDKGKLIDITSGTFTQTFASVASLVDGWWCYVRNSGTGDITIPASDGRTNWVMYPGEMRLFLSDGSDLRSIVIQAFDKTFTSSGTFVKPPCYARFGFNIRSGGNSGSRRASGTAAEGGGGGGSFPGEVVESKVSNSESVTVGSGGAAVTTDSTAGNPGGTSTFLGISVQANATRNLGGSAAASFMVGSTTNLGFETPPHQNTPGTYGGGATNPAISASGGNSIHGGGSGGSITSANVAGNGGASSTAGSGGNASISAAASAGLVPSGGGGASRNGFASGAGARGQVDVWGIA